MIKIISFLILATSGVTLHCQSFHLNGKLIEQQTGEPVPYAKIDIADLGGRTLEVLETDVNGNFSADIEASTSIRLYLSRDSFRTTSFILNTAMHDRGVDEKFIIEIKRSIFHVQPRETKSSIYAILFKISQVNIPVETPDLTDYSQLKVYKKDGKYFYTTGSFSSRAKAENYLRSMILDHHPTALVIEPQILFQMDPIRERKE